MNRLRELRIEKRLTLRELADILHMTYSNIAMIERGERNITSDNLLIFSEFFDVSIDYLLGISNIKTPVKNQSQKDQLKGMQLAMYNQAGELTEEQAKDVLEYIEFLKSKKQNHE